ncbi:MAG: DUF4143 domain-containing protein [Propionibacteriaceae bacterium]|jgi:predicted AAA+ superfamily ATPase|nr:DUF4143 domain-containing protein [Propionibacteriaceae bacterium]
MRRALLSDLESWKNDPHRKPLVLRGARQVGKTWLLREFGRSSFDRTIYVSLEDSPAARGIFSLDSDTKRIAASLALIDGAGAIDPATTLIILDEVQEEPAALRAMKYFAENAPEYHIACAGSLLGVALHAGTTFPVGKVDFLTLHPMTFLEFLDAQGRGDLANAIADFSPDLIAPFHEDLVEWLRWYLFVGGMPEVVERFSEARDTAAARRVQRQLLDAYEQDFSKHAPIEEVPRLRAIWRTIPEQLARENRRFIYGHISAGARAKMYELALLWLGDAGLVERVNRLTVPRVPLASYADDRAFKLYFHDIGLLGALAGLDQRAVIDGDVLFTEFKGALTEQYVCQQLVAQGMRPYYWTSDSGNAEVDFVIDRDGAPTPIEVKAHTNLRAKSLRTYREKYNPVIAVRTSLAPYERQEGLINLPLYAVGAITGGLKESN